MIYELSLQGALISLSIFYDCLTLQINSKESSMFSWWKNKNPLWKMHIAWKISFFYSFLYSSISDAPIPFLFIFLSSLLRKDHSCTHLESKQEFLKPGFNPRRWKKETFLQLWGREIEIKLWQSTAAWRSNLTWK